MRNIMRKLSVIAIFFVLVGEMAFSGVDEDKLFEYVNKTVTNVTNSHKERINYFCQSGSTSVRASSGAICGKNLDIATFIFHVCGALKGDNRYPGGVKSFIGSDCYNAALGKTTVGQNNFPYTPSLWYIIKPILMKLTINRAKSESQLEGKESFCALIGSSRVTDNRPAECPEQLIK